MSYAFLMRLASPHKWSPPPVISQRVASPLSGSISSPRALLSPNVVHAAHQAEAVRNDFEPQIPQCVASRIGLGSLQTEAERIESDPSIPQGASPRHILGRHTLGARSGSGLESLIPQGASPRLSLGTREGSPSMAARSGPPAVPLLNRPRSVTPSKAADEHDSSSGKIELTRVYRNAYDASLSTSASTGGDRHALKPDKLADDSSFGCRTPIIQVTEKPFTPRDPRHEEDAQALLGGELQQKSSSALGLRLRTIEDAQALLGDGLQHKSSSVPALSLRLKAIEEYQLGLNVEVMKSHNVVSEAQSLWDQRFKNLEDELAAFCDHVLSRNQASPSLLSTPIASSVAALPTCSVGRQVSSPRIGIAKPQSERDASPSQMSQWTKTFEASLKDYTEQVKRIEQEFGCRIKVLESQMARHSRYIDEEGPESFRSRLLELQSQLSEVKTSVLDRQQADIDTERQKFDQDIAPLQSRVEQIESMVHKPGQAGSDNGNYLVGPWAVSRLKTELDERIVAFEERVNGLASQAEQMQLTTRGIDVRVQDQQQQIVRIGGISHQCQAVQHQVTSKVDSFESGFAGFVASLEQWKVASWEQLKAAASLPSEVPESGSACVVFDAAEREKLETILASIEELDSGHSALEERVSSLTAQCQELVDDATCEFNAKLEPIYGLIQSLDAKHAELGNRSDGRITSLWNDADHLAAKAECVEETDVAANAEYVGYRDTSDPAAQEVLEDGVRVVQIGPLLREGSAVPVDVSADSCQIRPEASPDAAPEGSKRRNRSADRLSAELRKDRSAERLSALECNDLQLMIEDLQGQLSHLSQRGPS